MKIWEKSISVDICSNWPKISINHIWDSFQKCTAGIKKKIIFADFRRRKFGILSKSAEIQVYGAVNQEKNMFSKIPTVHSENYPKDDLYQFLVNLSKNPVRR